MLRQSIVFFKQINEAFTTGNAEFMTEHSVDDVQWNIVGVKTIHGKNELFLTIKKMKFSKADDLEYSYFITHGNKASINGTMSIGAKKYSFCHIYELNKFKNGKIKTITSYIVET